MAIKIQIIYIQSGKKFKEKSVSWGKRLKMVGEVRRMKNQWKLM